MDIPGKPLKIGIVGGGFSGVAVAALLARTHQGRPLELILCDKKGQFGAGPAYSTPYPYHLLNVRAQDMSAFEAEPTHFVDWLRADSERRAYFDPHTPIEQQFAPRCLYNDYLQTLLSSLNDAVAHPVNVVFQPAEVVDIELRESQAAMRLINQQQLIVDKVVLALGNEPPVTLPFAVDDSVQVIQNPWDYEAVACIPADDPVMIIGTGLSMIDAVLTLYHHQHRGKIHAISRHGLLPLPHADGKPMHALSPEMLNRSARAILRELRQTANQLIEAGGDWRAIINTLRTHLPSLWQQASVNDKKRFLRHLLPYWNIHRHRVHTEILDILTALSQQEQLVVRGARVQAVEKGEATILPRHAREKIKINTKWLINCMGPAAQFNPKIQPLISRLLDKGIATMDAMRMGFAVSPHAALINANGQASTQFFAVGAPTKGTTWEIGAVPEIRKQIMGLVNRIFDC